MASWRIPEQGIAIANTMLSVTPIDPDNAHAGFRIGVVIDDKVQFFDFDESGRLSRVRGRENGTHSPKRTVLWE